MGVAVYVEGLYLPGSLLKLILQIMTGALIYIGMSALLENQSYEYMIEIIRQKILTRKNRT
jgi:hypothetical protein